MLKKSKKPEATAPVDAPKNLTKNDCNILVDIFSKLRTALPYESVRNMGILKGHLKQLDSEEKDLIGAYADKQGTQYLYRNVKGKFEPISKPEAGHTDADEAPNPEEVPESEFYYTKAEYDKLSDELRAEIFFGSKDLIYHEVPPSNFVEFSKLREKLLLTEVDGEVRKVMVQDSKLQTISDSLVTGQIVDKNNLKEKLGDYIMLLEDYGYIEFDK